MKVELLSDGTLLIKAETEIESYALKVWHNDFSNFYNGRNSAYAALSIESVIGIKYNEVRK